jgi:hypothetical protein
VLFRANIDITCYFPPTKINFLKFKKPIIWRLSRLVVIFIGATNGIG